MTLPKPALGVYLVAGWPDVATYRAAVGVLKESADFFELGVPTASPKYDGPFIRRAHREVAVVDWSRPDVATYLMAYWEDHVHDPSRLFRLAVDIGARAVLAPDLLIDFPEELERYLDMSRGHGLSTAFFLPSKFPHVLAKNIAELKPDFIYLGLYAATGIELPIYVERNIELLKKITAGTYIVAGFAIDTPEKAARLIKAGADAVVVGTAFMKKLRSSLEEAASFLESIRTAISNAL
ncbi:MAG: tryptophan synthase subunit alpha [Pyrobaculum sp.]